MDKKAIAVGYFKLILILLFFIFLWLFSVSTKIIFAWFIVINMLASIIIIKYKNFNKKDIIIGVLLGVLCMPSSFLMGLFTILPYVGARCVFKESNNKIYTYNNKKSSNLIVTFILIFVVGGLLGIINVAGAVNIMKINPSFQLKYVFDALRAGIFEEIFFRMFFFAICVHWLKDKTLSKVQNQLCYVIMIVPHVLIHFTLSNFSLGNFIMLSFLFGMPFALMQRKWNLISAIGSHGIVNLIRFCVFGL